MATNEETFITSGRGKTQYQSVNSSQLLQHVSVSGEWESVSHDEGINEEDDEGVIEALKQCETLLTPYYIVAKALGWSHLLENQLPCITQKIQNRLSRIGRFILIFFWNVVITITFVTQILCCFTREKFNLGVLVNTTSNDGKTEIMCMDHLLSSFILFDLLVLAMYWSGVVISFVEDKESMYKLSERVCTTHQEYDKNLKNKNAGVKNRILIVLMWIYYGLGFIWVIVSLGIRFMSAKTLRLFSSQTIIRWNTTTFSGRGKKALVVVTVLGFITYDFVYFMAVMKYAVQSEILCHLLSTVRKQVEEKTKTLKKATEDLKVIQGMMNALNRKTATPTAIAIFILISNGIFAMITLDEIYRITRQFGGDFNVPLGVTTAVLNILFWMVPVVFVITQAARVTYQGKLLKETGNTLHIGSFLYKKTDQGELDSYRAHTQAARLKATMLGIPIYAALLLFIFITLIFLQTGNYALPSYV